MKLNTRAGLALALAAGVTASGCRSDATDRLAANGIAPVYNAQTGRLEQLLSDRDGDGKQETRAFMEGIVIKYIEIDRSGDGAADRWEYYGSAPNVIERADEAGGADARITRREFYGDGVIRRVVDDTDRDGRPDKWEHYDRGVLTRVELDLVGKGYPSQRLVYGPAGDVTRVETDKDGTGVFTRVSGTEAR